MAPAAVALAEFTAKCRSHVWKCTLAAGPVAT
jgi:hypothetical protein